MFYVRRLGLWVFVIFGQGLEKLQVITIYGWGGVWMGGLGVLLDMGGFGYEDGRMGILSDLVKFGKFEVWWIKYLFEGLKMRKNMFLEGFKSFYTLFKNFWKNVTIFSKTMQIQVILIV
jgi:hypothetical protein